MFNTFHGQSFDPAKFAPENVLIEDIAHALSYTVRFAGHIYAPYTVAQHSILVSRILKEMGAPADIQMQGLLHDATEAYIVDIPTPWKALLPDYKQLESNVWGVISQALNVPNKLDEMVKTADRIALYLEVRSYAPRQNNESFLEFVGRFGIDKHIIDSCAEFLTMDICKSACIIWTHSGANDVFITHYQALKSKLDNTLNQGVAIGKGHL